MRDRLCFRCSTTNILSAGYHQWEVNSAPAGADDHVTWGDWPMSCRSRWVDRLIQRSALSEICRGAHDHLSQRSASSEICRQAQQCIHEPVTSPWLIMQSFCCATISVSRCVFFFVLIRVCGWDWVLQISKA